MKNERDRILRGIYDENRSIRDLPGALRRKASKKRAWRLRRWFTPIAALIALTCFGLYMFIFMRHEREIPSVVNAGTMTVSVAASTARSSASAPEPDGFINADRGKNPDIHDNITLSRMFNLGIRRIVLDAGHGGSDIGAVGRGGTIEKDITLAIAMKLRDLLISYGVNNVMMTRTDDTAVSLQERVDYAKEAKADMFVSIHVNSLPNSSANVVETFYFGPSNDSRTLQLADIENMGSEYGLSDFAEIVERMGKTMKLQESKKLAEIIQKSLYKNAKELDPNTVDNGVKRAPFVVLMGLDVPSILAEIACVSSAKAERDLKSKENQERIAAALAAGIMSYQTREP